MGSRVRGGDGREGVREEEEREVESKEGEWGVKRESEEAWCEEGED